jgi:hypothetical protein
MGDKKEPQAAVKLVAPLPTANPTPAPAIVKVQTPAPKPVAPTTAPIKVAAPVAPPKKKNGIFHPLTSNSYRSEYVELYLRRFSRNVRHYYCTIVYL